MARSTTLARLEPLVGTWRSRGRTMPGPDDPGTEIDGTDAYEWFGDGFLMHRVDVRMGDAKIEVIELIGDHDPASGGYPMYAFDSQGAVGRMRATVTDDGVWTFADDSTRATLTIKADRSAMAARWQRRDAGGPWRHWMDMTFHKVA
ncbi:DUF1579 family protein [Plantactinospora sp. GCM10030261]|uniref:DUF1579 family protein n=1 Tax=Plantactinospora sp. GCM10030261 TaxID=3273420 RepID=UPI003619ABB6